MKRLLCLIMAIVILLIAVLTSSAFTVQSSRVYRSADSSGAYVVSFNGSHVDITRYTADSVSAGLNLSYTVSGVCAYHEKIVVFCNDTAHNYLIVYVYYLDTDMLDSFAIYDQKLNNDTDFCCDDNAIYIENHRNNSELMAFSYDGNLLNRYQFDQQIIGLCSGYDSGVYAVSDNTLYTLSGNLFTAVNGYEVEPPLSPAGSDVFVSEYGYAYVTDGNRIARSFTVDSRFGTAGGCVIGERLYYPNGSVINGYDISSDNKVSSYRLSFEPSLLWNNAGDIIAVGDRTYSSVNPDDFTELNRADNSNNASNQNASPVNNRSDSDNSAIGLSEISSDVYQVDQGRLYIYDIPPETTISQFKSNMRYDGWSVALYRDGSVKTSGSVGTAMTAVFSSGGNEFTFELSVNGDLTGEGNSNSRDVNLLLDYLIGAADFNGVYTVATDLSNDGRINAVDVALMKRTL